MRPGPRMRSRVPLLLLVLVLTVTSPPHVEAFFNPIRWVVRSFTGGQHPAYALRQLVHETFFVRPGARAQRTSNAQNSQVQPTLPEDEPFPCEVTAAHALPADPAPSSVHQLRPADLRVVAAMGDSLTAGAGAYSSNVFLVVTENRGSVWSIGGEGSWRSVLTLPNILREFKSSRLVGASHGDSLSHQRAAQFNVADSFALSSDMPHMARVLVRRIRADPRVDFYKDWKLVTLHVGGNDMCVEACQADLPGSVWERHALGLRAALDYLRDHLPRTFVNLVMVPEVTDLVGIEGRSILCRLINYLECPCLLSPSQALPRQLFSEMNQRMQRAEQELVASGRYDSSDNFTVVLQPFAKDFNFPTITGENGRKVPDLTYLSHDCFHMSQKGYAWAANALWNNMLEPIGRKKVGLDPIFSRFLCPTPDRPYIFTARNSNVTDGGGSGG